MSSIRKLMFAAVAAIAPVAFAIVETTCDHPAAREAVRIISSRVPPSAGVRLEVAAGPSLKGLKHDGYTAVREGGTVVVRAARPRSLLFAAGETGRWLGAGATPIVRDPAFKTRMLNETGSSRPPAEWIAATGCNAVHLARNAKPREVDAWKQADVEVYAFLYGCNPLKWNAKSCEDWLAGHPSARGVDRGRSWEKGVMCPSDEATWRFFADKVRAVATAADYDGIVVTFWDDYGLYCGCERCRETGLDKFPAEIAAIVKCFESALKPLGKKLIVRTWASGAPHFLRDEWVHAPGYSGPDDAIATWGRAFAESSPDTVFQTKVYNCDCQPDAPFSLLLGRAAGRTEMAEWQITGQTVGLQWLPASVVDHTRRTMSRAFELTGPEGGVCLYAGGYQNRGYEALDDVVNSVNIHAWRQLSWNPGDDVEKIWREWAAPIYGEDAEAAVAAMKLSEPASVAAFSPLGLGAPTESRFAGTVRRREDLLRYTNRQYPDAERTAVAALAPTKENIARVVREKTMWLGPLAEARSRLGAGAASAELALRLEWLEAQLVVARALDGALWRYRYLRHLRDMATTDAETMREIEADFETVRKNGQNLFRHTPSLRLSCYGEPLGERDVSLRSPVPLMRDIMTNALECVERIAGPEWRELR